MLKLCDEGRLKNEQQTTQITNWQASMRRFLDANEKSTNFDMLRTEARDATRALRFAPNDVQDAEKWSDDVSIIKDDLHTYLQRNDDYSFLVRLPTAQDSLSKAYRASEARSVTKEGKKHQILEKAGFPALKKKWTAYQASMSQSCASQDQSSVEGDCNRAERFRAFATAVSDLASKWEETIGTLCPYPVAMVGDTKFKSLRDEVVKTMRGEHPNHPAPDSQVGEDPGGSSDRAGPSVVAWGSQSSAAR